MARRPVGNELIEKAMKFGFKTSKGGEMEKEELNKLSKDEKLDYLLQFLASKVLTESKVSIMGELDIESIAQLAQVPSDKISVGSALSLYEELSDREKINDIREADPDEALRSAIVEEEAMNKVMEKELENLKKQEALYLIKDAKNKEIAKVLDSNLMAVRSSKQILGDTIKSTNKHVEEAMGFLAKVVTDVVDLMSKENKNEEGVGRLKDCVPTTVILAAVENYKSFVVRIKEQLGKIAELIEKEEGPTTNPVLKETLEELNSLMQDTLSVKETNLNLKLYEKRLDATEKLLASDSLKEDLESTTELPDEQTKIEELHSEIKATLKSMSEWEISSKFTKYTEQLAGNDISALIPSVLTKAEEIINKHISLSGVLLSSLQTEKGFVQRLYDALAELNTGMEGLAKKLESNIEFIGSSVQEPLQQKPAIDERDDLLQALKEFLFSALEGKVKMQKAGAVEELVSQMKQFSKEAEKMLEGESIVTAFNKLEELKELEDELIKESIEHVTAGECRVECDIIRKKLCELIDKKELLAKMIKKMSEDFASAKAKEIYKDVESGLTINDIFIDFLLYQCENIDKRIDELKKTSPGGADKFVEIKKSLSEN